MGLEAENQTECCCVGELSRRHVFSRAWFSARLTEECNAGSMGPGCEAGQAVRPQRKHIRERAEFCVVIANAATFAARTMASASNTPTTAQPGSPTPEETQLRDSLKRCSAQAVEAAVRYRSTKEVELVPTIVLGIIERFLEPGAVERLRQADDDVRVIEDLGLDSLTLMEAVILIEEVVQISINNDELRSLRTVGDIKVFIDHKVRGLPPPQPSKYMPIEQVAAIMPQQPPFLFVREATLSSAWATGTYTITGDEDFLAGHFKENPIFPASIMLEALGQLAVLFLLEAPGSQLGAPVDPKTIFFTGAEGVRCHRVCRPGDVLKLSVKPKRLRMPLATFEGHIRVGQERAAVAEEISLTFGFLVEAPPGPQSAAESSAAPVAG